MRGQPETTDEYLAPLTTDERTAFEKVRKTIPSAFPEVGERTSCLPILRLRGWEI